MMRHLMRHRVTHPMAHVKGAEVDPVSGSLDDPWLRSHVRSRKTALEQSRICIAVDPHDFAYLDLGLNQRRRAADPPPNVVAVGARSLC